jgi:hypothetical protein
MKLDELKVFPHPAGFQHRELFDNGFGVSVIPENVSSEDPLFEVAVLQHMEGKKAHLTYETEITNDVVRYCTIDEVDCLIDRVRNLPPWISRI